MDTRELPDRPNLEQYKKRAKDLLKARDADRPDAVQRIRASHPHASKLARFTLADAQLVIAREHGFQSWPKFAKHIAELTQDPALIWKLAERAVITGDVGSLQSLLREHDQMFREGTAPEYGPGGLRPDYSGGDAAAVLIREHQFETWPQFENYLAERAHGTALAAKFEAAADAIVAAMPRLSSDCSAKTESWFMPVRRANTKLRCCTTLAESMVARAIAKNVPRMRLKLQKSCWRPAPRSMFWRAHTATVRLWVRWQPASNPSWRE
jgi:hypothetical protein